MKKPAFVLLAACGLAACSHREPTDLQLGTLLRSDRADPTDTNPVPAIDSNFIGCLRAWSGDTALMTGVPPVFASEDGKKGCRERLDKRIADAAYNRGKLTFADISAPSVVRHAIALTAARRLATMNANAARPPPAALANAAKAPAPTAPPPAPPPVLGPPIELGADGGRLQEGEHLCEQAVQRAGTSDNAGLKNFGAYCGNSFKRMREAMESAAARGDAAKLASYSKTLGRLLDAAHIAVDGGPKK